jgi:hypothetical protein
MPITNELEALKALLSCVGADGVRGSDVWLEEKDPSAKLKKLMLTELDSGVIVLEPDKGRKIGTTVCMSPLFHLEDGTYGQNRACDAVVIRQSKQKKGIELFYIELKSDAPSGYEGQFKSTACFMRYVCDLCKQLCDYSIEVVRERYIVFHTDSSGKKTLGPRPKPRFDPKSKNTPMSPEKIIVVNEQDYRCTGIF